MAETMLLASGYDRTKSPEKKTYRPMTVEEMLNLGSGDHPVFLANDGTARRIAVNGKPKTWKTRPQDVRVPLKYGMYEFGYAEHIGGSYHGVTLLVPVSGEETERHDGSGGPFNFISDYASAGNRL